MMMMKDVVRICNRDVIKAIKCKQEIYIRLYVCVCARVCV